MTLTLKAKMIGTVAMLALLSVILSAIGVSGLSRLHDMAEEVDLASNRLELALIAKTDLITWFRDNENLLRTDLTPNAIKEIRQDATEARTHLEAGSVELAKAVFSEAGKANMRKVMELTAQFKALESKANALLDQGNRAEQAKVILSGADLDDEILKNLGQIVDRNNARQADAIKQSSNTYQDRSSLMWGASVVGIILLAGLGLWVIIGGVVQPLSLITEAMVAVSEGQLDGEVPGAGRQDEVGRLAKALTAFKDNALEARRLAAEQEQQKQRAVEDKRRQMSQLADGFESSVRNVVNAVATAATEMQSNAQTLSATAEQTNRQAVAVAAAAEQASANVQTVAAATEELSSSVSEISRQVTESSRIAGTAVDEANRTNQTVASLSEAAQKIGEVVGLINNIASQTNLLALNATIEAARAGEAGKGFAVVASEVKNLANQTAKATDDIQAQVGQMQAVTSTAVEAIQSITGTIRRMSEITTTIASAVEEQGAATREIARNVSEASAGTQEVSSHIGGVTQAAGETGQMAGSVLGAAADLTRQADRLRQEVDGFVARVRQS